MLASLTKWCGRKYNLFDVMNNTLLSIVIPTRNRQKYCLAAVEQILSLNLEEIEVVIQDNSDDSSLQNLLDGYITSNGIVYNYRGGIVSFVDNFSEAISLSHGEYVCMIGDDDGILPNIISVTKSAKQNGIDCVIAGLNAVYLWPNTEPIVPNSENGYLCVSYLKHKEVIADSRKALKKLVAQGAQGYQNLDLPRVYHGIVKRSKMDDVKSVVGNYFDGLTPDIFIAVALSCVCERVIRLSYPVTVSGICPTSGSSNSATGRHTGELKDAPHFKGHDKYIWDSKIPAFYSVETIWAETALHALKVFGKNDLYSKFNIQYLDNLCLSKYPKYANMIRQHAKDYGVKLCGTKVNKTFGTVLNLMSRIWKRLSHLGFGVRKYYDIYDLNTAVMIVRRYLR